MGRTSSGADAKLIKAGLALARTKGIEGFTLRELCAKSNVNLGMFHYYFTSKDNFDKILLGRFYSQMVDSMRISISDSASPRENIRGILLVLWDFIVKNRVMLSSLLGDVLSGNKKIIKYISNDFTMHVHILYNELEKAAKNKDLKVASASEAMLLLIPPLALPNLILGLSERVSDNLLDKISSKLTHVKFNSNCAKHVDMLLDLIFKEK